MRLQLTFKDNLMDITLTSKACFITVTSHSLEMEVQRKVSVLVFLWMPENISQRRNLFRNNLMDWHCSKIGKGDVLEIKTHLYTQDNFQLNLLNLNVLRLMDSWFFLTTYCLKWFFSHFRNVFVITFTHCLEIVHAAFWLLVIGFVVLDDISMLVSLGIKFIHLHQHLSQVKWWKVHLFVNFVI